MYAVTDKTPLDASLAAYLDTPFVQSCRLTGSPPAYECVLPQRDDGFHVRCSGVHRALNRRYFHAKKQRFRRPRRNRSSKQSSSVAQGLRVHQEVFDYVASGKKPRNALTKALLTHVERKLGHELLACEVPVYIAQLNCMTQVDFITRHVASDTLHMWELKCGRGASRRNPAPIELADGTLVPNTTLNHWEFQRHFSCLGLRRGKVAIELKNSHVINIFRLRKKKTPQVKVRKHSAWTRKLPS